MKAAMIGKLKGKMPAPADAKEYQLDEADMPADDQAAGSGIDLSACSDEELMAEMKKRGLSMDHEETPAGEAEAHSDEQAAGA